MCIKTEITSEDISTTSKQEKKYSTNLFTLINREIVDIDQKFNSLSRLYI